MDFYLVNQVGCVPPCLGQVRSGQVRLGYVGFGAGVGQVRLG